MPTIDPTFTRPTALLKYQEQARGDPLSVIVAAGPYTLDSDFEYAPLAALLEKVAEERPDVLILVRPSLIFFSPPLFFQLTFPIFKAWSICRRAAQSH
jgi:hypothetical protein